jgi:hypothetical protein
MRRLTFSNVKTEAAEILGVSLANTNGLAKVLSRLNEAQERLLNRADAPNGGKMRYRVCLSASDNNCLVWPRQLRTIEAYWLCNTPGTVVTSWHEAIGWDRGGHGLFDTDGYNGSLLIDHGTTHSFDNVIATTTEPRKLQFVASDPSDNGKIVHVRYVDSNANRKYSTISGSIQEGENLTLSTSGVLTSSNLATGGWYHVVKATTNYPVRVYSYDVNSASQAALLAVYEPSETHPLYRRSLVPGLAESGSCSGVSGSCTASHIVTVLARLQHVPVLVDNDPFVITNAPALLDMVRSIQLARDNFNTDAADWEARAKRELDGEIAAHNGDGVLITPRYAEGAVWGAGGIYNPA